MNQGHGRLRSALPALLLLLAFCLLTACGKQKKEPEDAEETPSGPQIMEVRIDNDNFLQYFEYKEEHTFSTDEDGNITACNFTHGFALRDGLVAANDPEHKDTLKVNFTAVGLSQHGEFDIDFQTLTYTPLWVDTENSTQTTFSVSLDFWPQGNRTIFYPFGLLSSAYILQIQSYSVSAGGSIFLRVR